MPVAKLQPKLIGKQVKLNGTTVARLFGAKRGSDGAYGGTYGYEFQGEFVDGFGSYREAVNAAKFAVLQAIGPQSEPKKRERPKKDEPQYKQSTAGLSLANVWK